MILFSAQYRIHDVDRIDITRAGCERALKGGKPAPGLPWAPSARLVFPTLRALRAAECDSEREIIWTAYVASYREEMKASYRRHRAAWEELLARPRAVIVCFCPEPSRCHRSVAASFLARCGADYRGELAIEDAIAAPPELEPPPAIPPVGDAPPPRGSKPLSERNRMVSATVYPTTEQAAALDALSRSTRVPMAVFYREAIDMVLAKHEPTAADAPRPA